jgi:hypothetical protein
MKHYLFITWGDIDPEILGPFESEDTRDDRAKELKKEHGDENGIFMLDVEDNGMPSANAYSGGFFKDVEDNADEDSQ